jgi:hypothetical protein
VLASYAVTSAAVRLAIPPLAERLQPRALMAGALALTAAVFCCTRAAQRLGHGRLRRRWAWGWVPSSRR